MAETKINGRTFRYDRLPATKAFALSMRLARTMGPAMAELAPVLEKAEQEDPTADAIAPIMRALGSIDPVEVEALAAELLKDVRVDGDLIGRNIDAYIGDMREMVEVCLFVIKTEYADFFGGSPVAVPAKGRAARA